MPILGTYDVILDWEMYKWIYNKNLSNRLDSVLSLRSTRSYFTRSISILCPVRGIAGCYFRFYTFMLLYLFYTYNRDLG